MKRIYLLRHANAIRDGREDFDRPLSDRGRDEAAAIGSEIVARGWRPDLILCSAAVRTRETLESLGALAEVPVVYEKRIYEAGTRVLLELLRDPPDGPGSIMLVGHNPGIEDLAALLAPEVERGFRTGTLGALLYPRGGWKKLGARSCRLIEIIDPHQAEFAGPPRSPVPAER